MSDNQPWRHHYIPQFLLRQWAGNDGMIERYTRPHKSLIRERVSTKAAGFQRNLYATSDTSMQLEDTFFKQVDNNAATAHQKLLDDHDLTDEDKVNWAIFLRAMMHRTPQDVLVFKEAAAAHLQSMLPRLEQVYQSVRGSNDPIDFEEYLRKRRPTDDERMALLSMPKIVLNQRIIDSILELPWLVIHLRCARQSFMISDSPIIRSNGLKVSGGHLAMPIGPRRLFFVHFDDHAKEHVLSMSERQLVTACNSEVVGRARSLVVSNDPSQTRFIENRMGKLDRTYLIDARRAKPEESGS